MIQSDQKRKKLVIHAAPPCTEHYKMRIKCTSSTAPLCRSF